MGKDADAKGGGDADLLPVLVLAGECMRSHARASHLHLLPLPSRHGFHSLVYPNAHTHMTTVIPSPNDWTFSGAPVNFTDYKM